MILQRQIIVDYSDSYIFDIDYSTAFTSLYISLSNNSISRYDTSRFSLIENKVVHDNRINCLEASSLNDNVIFTASSDKRICVWDWRIAARAPVITLRLADEVLDISVGLEEALVASACGQSVVFFDIRGGNGAKPLAEYSDCHSDLVTVVRFCPHQLSTLISGGEDGLVCIYETAVSADENAVKSILNTEAPMRKVGFFGPNEEGLLCLSSVETASAWHYPTAQRVANYPTIRAEAAADYLVDTWYDKSTDSLQVVAGVFSGDANVCSLTPRGVVPWASLEGGHRDTVRCARVLPVACSDTGPTLVTGGEDGRLCVWAASGSTAVGSEPTDHHASRGGMKQSQSRSTRYSPY